jgi:hypothetical protein
VDIKEIAPHMRPAPTEVLGLDPGIRPLANSSLKPAARYSGSAIRLRQQKTGALLDVPTHPVLREHLDALARSSTSLTIITYRGRPGEISAVQRTVPADRDRAQIDGQARDLRRTAMVRMAEAGPTVPQIASVSGHSIEATQRVLETYLPRNRALAEIAISRLADLRTTKGGQSPTRWIKNDPLVIEK